MKKEKKRKKPIRQSTSTPKPGRTCFSLAQMVVELSLAQTQKKKKDRRICWAANQSSSTESNRTHFSPAWMAGPGPA